MKALVFNNLVVDVAEQEFPVHPSMSWVDCPDHIEGGKYSYDGASFTILPLYDNEDLVLSPEEDLQAVRDERNKRLAETDFWSAPDTPDMTQEQINYRQALRDITELYQSIEKVVWPEKP